MWFYTPAGVLASASEVWRPSGRLFRKACWIPQRDAEGKIRVRDFGRRTDA
jgi:hypothetical protein